MSLFTASAIAMCTLPSVGGYATQTPVMYEKNVIWDIDFETQTVDTGKKPSIIICDADGNALKSSVGDKFWCHIGSDESSVSIVKPESSKDNKALCLSPGNSSDTVQTNDLFFTAKQGIAIFEYDMMINDYATDRPVIYPVYKTAGNEAVSWATRLYVKKNTSSTANRDGTKFYFGSLDTGVSCIKNQWYHLRALYDFDADTIDYYIDNKHVGNYVSEGDMVSTVRMSLRALGKAGSNLYIDNLRVYEATTEPYAKLNLYIDGKESDRLKAGNLSVGATITGGYENLDCVFALYSGSKLKAVRWVQNAATDVASSSTIEPEEMGQIDETMTLKLLLLNSDSIVKPQEKCVTADRYGTDEETMDLENVKTIFESETPVKTLLSGKYGYHPDSGVFTYNGTKTATNLKGEWSNGVLMVPAEVFGYIDGVSVRQYNSGQTASIGSCVVKAGSTSATLGGKAITLSSAPYIKDGRLCVPMQCIIEKALSKNFYATPSGINSGAVVIGTGAFEPSDDIIQKLNYYLLYERPTKEKILEDYNSSSLKGVHPRVIMTGADFERVKNANDSKTATQKSKLISRANSYLNQPKLVYELRDGVRLWYVSMDFMDRVMSLAFAYRISGDERYFDKCVEEMDSISSFPDWHPEHHIDVGGLAVGLAAGYDWLYNDLDDKQRARYEAAVYDLCYKEYYKGFTDASNDMKGGVLADNNHNSVMNSGITMCAVAFMDEFPELGAYFISNSIKATERTVSNFWPDGSWYEGVGYGCMTLEYLSLQLASMQNLFGTTYSIDASAGMDRASHYVVNMQSPTGAFGFYDGGSTGLQWHSGTLWFANHFGAYDVVDQWRNLYIGIGETARSTVSSLMFYNLESIGGEVTLPPDTCYTENAITLMRDSWTSSAPTFIGAKGGFAADAHGHMDMGTFTFYSNGVRWLDDYGAEDYNLPGFWSGGSIDGLRWQYFTMRAEAHNCLVINPDSNGEYDPMAKAKFTRFETNDNSALAVLDMTNVHNGKAQSAQRGYYFADGRKSLVVRDEVSVSETSDIYFFLQTGHKVSVSGNKVVITDKSNSSKTLTIEFASNRDFTLEKGDAVPLPTSPTPDGLKSTAGKTRIMLKTRASGDVNITAKFTPSNVSGSSVDNFDISIDNWKLS